MTEQERSEHTRLDSDTNTAPIMIVAFEGWNDAGDAASTAVEHLQLSWDATSVGELNPDDYYDFQVTRPTVNVVDGVSRSLEWATTTLSTSSPEGLDQQVVFVKGPEPNFRWRAFCTDLLERAEQFGVAKVVTLGALLADTAHTRPIPVTGSAHETAALDRSNIDRSKYQGPTGITGVFHDACVQAGIPAVSLWAAVPHYVSHPPCPKATLALLRTLEDVVDVEIPMGTLPEQAEEWQRTVSELAEDDEEVSEYVRSLEERGDEQRGLEETSGEQLAADFQRYLRRRRPGPGQNT
ncbi:Predicted ATP-dependent carboligase, ATP-grasp superfamily [Haloechinothrix alba]|uniref:Predicted ATP-dependent carboligase, ATP-grasp superfamily n=2 Tax=Haloechinothrix alba TaxID=664784 RepID=A0A238XBI7_9PSEU|nr:Predicted ATP-dependent carboligase, ATP-grasp superfamily [Haloechinothrix alba]